MAKSVAAFLLLVFAATEALALSGATPDLNDRFPYVVAIKYRQRFVCSGTVLFPRIVVTAAHCVQKELDMRKNLFADEYLRRSQLTVVAVRNGKPESYAVANVIASPVWRNYVAKPNAGERYAYDLGLHHHQGPDRRPDSAKPAEPRRRLAGADPHCAGRGKRGRGGRWHAGLAGHSRRGAHP